MAKFILAYHGGTMPTTPEEVQQVMAAWGGWMQKYSDVMADPGCPLGQSHTISKDGVVDNGGANPLSGYSIIEAADYDAAIAIAKECPQAQGGSIEVAELKPM